MGFLNTEKPYTWPMERWMASAAGTISQRLNSLGAMIALREKKDMGRYLASGCINYERNHNPHV